MNTQLQNIIKFYSDCYQFEYSSIKVSNFYSSSVNHLFYPKTFKLLSQQDYELPVDTLWGETVDTELKLESSEKKLICATFFIKGKVEILGKSHKLFTPLFLIDASLRCIDEVYYLRVDSDSINLNPIAINYLNTLDADNTHLYDDLISDLLQETNLFSFSGLVNLQHTLAEKYPTLDYSLLDKRLETDKRIIDLDLVYNARKKTYEQMLFPEIVVGVVEKPKKTKDVVNELMDLSTRGNLQKSILSSIFFDQRKKREKKTQSLQEVIVPVSLSQNQQKILQSANDADVSVVIGPPGTGKSFSIAALAIQAFHEGKKVLIASKNEQACQVLYHKIQEDIGVKGIAINASKARYRISVAAKLRNIANGVGVKPLDATTIARMESEVRLYKKEIGKITAEITKREAIEKNWGEKLSFKNKSIFKGIQKKWITYRHSLKDPIWDLKYQLHRLDNKLKRKEKRLITEVYKNNLSTLLKTNRSKVREYAKVFEERKGNTIKEFFSSFNFQVILEALPIWICRSMDIANIVPLEKGLFDLLIIDEASQCDIASSIPLIYRAKSIVAVGDPQQLRHLSFISKRKENITKTKYHLNKLDISYRDRSILDQINERVSSQDNITFLDEHFRSMPDLIHFSNNEFYSGQLKIMTEHFNERNYNNLTVKYLKEGQRNEKGENIEEANQIMQGIEKVVENELLYVKHNCSKIGIISPFRSQVQLIKKLLRNKFDAKTILKHRILVGTPFSFQGEERDIMFLSFTIDEQTHHGTIRYLERPDVFNVSITRAKNTQEVFISINPNKLPPTSLLSKYLSSELLENRRRRNRPSFDDFLTEVKEVLEEFNFGEIFTDKNICGTQIDIVIVQKERTLGIDLIGFPGEFTALLTMDELMSLERAKIDVFLLPYSTWHLDRDLCLNALKAFINGSKAQ